MGFCCDANRLRKFGLGNGGRAAIGVEGRNVYCQATKSYETQFHSKYSINLPIATLITKTQRGNSSVVERSLCMREAQGSNPCYSNVADIRFLSFMFPTFGATGVWTDSNYIYISRDRGLNLWLSRPGLFSLAVGYSPAMDFGRSTSC